MRELILGVVVGAGALGAGFSKMYENYKGLRASQALEARVEMRAVPVSPVGSVSYSLGVGQPVTGDYVVPAMADRAGEGVDNVVAQVSDYLFKDNSLQ